MKHVKFIAIAILGILHGLFGELLGAILVILAIAGAVLICVVAAERFEGPWVLAVTIPSLAVIAVVTFWSVRFLNRPNLFTGGTTQDDHKNNDSA